MIIIANNMGVSLKSGASFHLNVGGGAVYDVKPLRPKSHVWVGAGRSG